MLINNQTMVRCIIENIIIIGIISNWITTGDEDVGEVKGG